MQDIKAPIALLVALLIFTGLAYVGFIVLGAPNAHAPVRPSSEVSAPQPPTPAMIEYLKNSKGFQALVSYNETGFHPAELNIKKGDTIRFANNSSHDMWIAASDAKGKVYPGTSSDCGSSPLDSCRSIHPGEFWEFTFKVGGLWGFVNNLQKDQTGVVLIHVE